MCRNGILIAIRGLVITIIFQDDVKLVFFFFLFACLAVKERSLSSTLE